MQRVEHSEYILIRAYTDSEWDSCDFAVIHATPEWKTLMKEKVEKAMKFKGNSGFYYLVYAGGPEGFYKDDEGFSIDDVLDSEENSCYVDIQQTNLHKFPAPASKLHLYQMFIDEEGIMRYKAYGKHTGEEYYTAEFSAKDLLSPTII